MRKKKVLFMLECMVVGGAERVLIDIVNQLDPNKYDITVCSVFKNSIYPYYRQTFKDPFNNNITYKYIINNDNILLYKLFNHMVLKIPSVLYSLFIGDKYDKVIAFYEGFPTYWISKANIDNDKKIAWLHTSTSLSQEYKNRIELLQQEEYYKKYKSIIGVSKGVINSFINLFPSCKNKMQVIYNPINIDTIKEKSKVPVNIDDSNVPLFVSVGRICKAKGYDRWLRVLKSLKELDYKFKSLIIGGGDSTELKKYIQDNELESYVELLGHKDNPYPYILKADWIVVPSFVEGLCTVVIESVILNKSVIVTECPGMNDILGDNEYGIILGNTEEELLEAMKNIMENPSLREEYKNKVRNNPILDEFKYSIKNIESIINA